MTLICDRCDSRMDSAHAHVTAGESIGVICDLCHALARAEAAEVSREQLADRLAFEMGQRELLAARVAELEARPAGYLAALDARDEVMHVLFRIAALVDVPGNGPFEDIVSAVRRLVAAQSWRPVTERPTEVAQYQVALQYGNRRPTADHMAYYPDTGWAGTGVIFWRPIPPLPAPEATTP